MKYTKMLVEEPLDADDVKIRITYNSDFTKMALMVLYEHQTPEERSNAETNTENSMGFNKLDAEICTNLAKFYLEKGFLSPKQLGLVRKKITKYSKQLSKISKRGPEYYN